MRTISNLKSEIEAGFLTAPANSISMKGQMDVSTPEEYLEALEEPRKSEVEHIHRLIRETVPELEPHICSGMLGYGRYHYKYASGREGDWCKVGLASNKNSISLYISVVVNGQCLAESYKPKLPKANIGKSCIRFKRFDEWISRWFAKYS